MLGPKALTSDGREVLQGSIRFSHGDDSMLLVVVVLAMVMAHQSTAFLAPWLRSLSLLALSA